MTREEKTAVIEQLTQQFIDNKYFYVADCSTMTVARVNKLRRTCFEKGLQLRLVKNSLIKTALQRAQAQTGTSYDGLYPALKGSSALIFTETSNLPARMIKEFRETNENEERPTVKAAYIDSDVFLGDEQLDALCKLKSKEEFIADVIALLQGPIQKVIGAINSGSNTIGGLLKTLEERSA